MSEPKIHNLNAEAEQHGNQLAAAWVKAIKSVRNPILDSEANYGRYPSLKRVMECARGAMPTELIIYHFVLSADENNTNDRCVLRVQHHNGDFMDVGEWPLYCVDKNNPQKFAASFTYARRYVTMGAFGLVGINEDDDAQSAVAEHDLPNMTPEIWTAEALEIFKKLENTTELKSWAEVNKAGVETLPYEQKQTLREAYSKRNSELKNEIKTEVN